MDFSDIVEQSRAMRSLQEAAASNLTESIPHIERALPQIDFESRRLAIGNDQRAGSSGDARALRLLSEYGYETDRIERSLQSAALLDAFEPLQTFLDTDLQSYLDAHNELVVASAIDLALRRAKTRSLSSLASSIDAEWDVAKRDLLTLPSTSAVHPHHRASQQLSLSATTAFTSPFRQPRSTRLSSSLQTPKLLTASSVSIYHDIIRRAVFERGSFSPNIPVATEFDDCLLRNMAPRGDYNLAPKGVQQLHAVYNALRYIANEYKSPSPSAGYFGKRSVEELSRQTCIGAHRFLCLQFREDKMRREIETRPVEARRGGVPGVRADVRAFLNLVFDRGVPDQLARGPMYDGMPVWSFVYYFLRAGFVEEASLLVDDAISIGCMHGNLRLFSECLHAYIESGDKRALPRELSERLVQEYGVSVKRGDDPYQRVCFVVIARVDPSAGDKVALLDSDYGLLFYSIEDYLWLRLSVARLQGDEPLPEALAAYELTLPAVGEEIRRFGPSHFNAHGDSATFYALVLILTGQFKEAITYLEERARALTEATHIAFILYYYGMIRDRGSLDSSVGNGRNEANNQYVVDYSGLIWRYASQTSRSDVGVAAIYVFTIEDSMMRKELLKKLLLESKGFDILVGRTGGGGMLSELWSKREMDKEGGMDGWRMVVVEAGEEAERKGDRESALKLYDIAGVQGKMMNIYLNRVSAEVSSQVSVHRQRVLDEARRYLAEIRTKGADSGVSDKELGSLQVLLEMGEFFSLRWQEKHEEALTVLERMRILPKDDEEVMSKVRELGYGSGSWTEAVIDRVPDLVVAAMEVLSNVYTERDGISEEERRRLRRWAKSIVNLSGMMRNLSADMSARLVGLEVIMN